MINLMTRVGYETRIALNQLQNNAQSAAANHLIAADARELVDYLLFVDEAPLPGSSTRRPDSSSSSSATARGTAAAAA